jgi:uncharacterized membrane protein
VDLYDWLLFLHVLSAFAAVASVVVFTVMLAAGDSAGAATLRLTALGRRLWDVGGTGTLVLGVWLALHVGGYDLLDGWILAAFLLWAIAAGSGIRLGMGYQQAAAGEGQADGPRPVVLWAVMTVAVAALLVDMIFKPGA